MKHKLPKKLWLVGGHTVIKHSESLGDRTFHVPKGWIDTEYAKKLFGDLVFESLLEDGELLEQEPKKEKGGTT